METQCCLRYDGMIRRRRKKSACSRTIRHWLGHGRRDRAHTHALVSRSQLTNMLHSKQSEKFAASCKALIRVASCPSGNMQSRKVEFDHRTNVAHASGRHSQQAAGPEQNRDMPAAPNIGSF